jgi:CHRD domain
MQAKNTQLRLLDMFRYVPILSLYLMTISGLVVSIPAFAQQSDFGVTLLGSNLSPPVTTKASGTAKFNVDQQGNMAYQIDVKNIRGL